MIKQAKPTTPHVEIKDKAASSKQTTPKRPSVGKTLDDKLLRKVGGGNLPVNRW